jgi:BirA family biotin operon repressor/biotin-[acetyl-CoA-carboxylase] ligase
MAFKVIHLEETDSTNRWLKANGSNSDMVVWTDYQSAGRGCGSNTWESERGKNLLFSVLVHPHRLEAASQFVISMANALALKAALDEYTEGIMVKWPNDIYWHDRKLAGTLIETTLGDGHVKTCILGTGVNINQHMFRSDAPNPVSLSQIVGHEIDREELLASIITHLEYYLDQVEQRRWELIRTRYKAHLWRKDGRPHLFQLPDGHEITCQLMTVDDDGTLVLEDEQAQQRRFGFKEVQFVL